MGEMYKFMGISVPPRPPARVYPYRGPLCTQQSDPSLPSFTQPITSMPIFTQPIPSMKAPGPSYTQFELSTPHFPESGHTMPLFPLSDLSIQARPIRCIDRYPLLGVARTLRRKSSWSLTRSLTRIGDDSGLYYFYMTRYYMNNLIFMFGCMNNLIFNILIFV
ncbi:hypothetical protein Hanom_Chr01g00066371 [Helianthus anomalus]